MFGPSSPFGCTLLAMALRDVRQIVETMEPALLSGAEAAATVAQFAEIERIAAAGRVVLANRVNETGAWQAEGHRSAAEWMASNTGQTVS